VFAVGGNALLRRRTQSSRGICEVDFAWDREDMVLPGISPVDDGLELFFVDIVLPCCKRQDPMRQSYWHNLPCWYRAGRPTSNGSDEATGFLGMPTMVSGEYEEQGLYRNHHRRMKSRKEIP
jgi:hypothetical protein